MANWEFVLSVNVHPTRSTTIIPKILVVVEPNIDEDDVINCNVDRAIEKDSNQIDVDSVQASIFPIHPLTNDIPNPYFSNTQVSNP